VLIANWTEDIPRAIGLFHQHLLQAA